MKVSKERRDEIRRALIRAAVDLFVEQGISETSVREIAARASVAPGTAYKYFPDREQLVRAFFEVKFEDAVAALSGIEGIETYTLKERLHALLEALLEECLPDREFVAMAIRGLVDAPLQSFEAMQPVRLRWVGIVDSMIDEAVVHGELDAPRHRGFLSNAFWDYTILVVLYWLNDHSEGFAKSTEFIDKSLDLYITLVRSGIVDQAARLGMFFFKNHLYANFEHLTSLLGMLADLKTSRIGRRQ